MSATSDAGRSPAPRLTLVCALAFAASTLPSTAHAQAGDPEALIAECVAPEGPGGSFAAVCREAALGAQAAHALAGLAASGGALVPGSASTLGLRFDGTPRFSFSVRGSMVRGDLPSPTTGAQNGAGPLALQSSLALGLFRGFSVLPTVSGILAVDLVGTGAWLFLPEADGFNSDPSAWGYGVRVGLLRESFTTPGVTVSASRRELGDLAVGRPGEGRWAADLSSRVTSVRGTVGKDLFALGVLAGVGWDRYTSDGRYTVVAGSERNGLIDGFESERTLWFGSLAWHHLLLQLSVEGGWASGFDAVPGDPAAFDPEDGSFFLSVAARLIL